MSLSLSRQQLHAILIGIGFLAFFQFHKFFTPSILESFHGTHYLFMTYAHGFILRGLLGSLVDLVFLWPSPADKIYLIPILSYLAFLGLLTAQLLFLRRQLLQTPDNALQIIFPHALFVASPFYANLGHLVGYPDALLYLLFIATYLLLEKREWKGASAAIIVGLATHEFFLFLLLPLLWVQLRHEPRKVQFGFLGLVLGTTAAFLALNTKSAFAPLLATVPFGDMKPALYFYTRSFSQTLHDMIVTEWGQGFCAPVMAYYLFWGFLLLLTQRLSRQISASMALVCFMPLGAYVIALDFFRFAMACWFLALWIPQSMAIKQPPLLWNKKLTLLGGGIIALMIILALPSPLYCTGRCSRMAMLWPSWISH